MTVSDVSVGSLSFEAFRDRLRGAGLGMRVGPFDVCLRARVRDLEEPLYRLYRDHPLLSLERAFSCHLALHERWRLRPRPGRYVRFSVDGRAPHEDMPAGQALAVLEWGLNLVIALRSHQFLMLHSAVVERRGLALVLPAAPGCGKTTLCAGLAQRGWRLLSDEFGLLHAGSTECTPIPRPMPLKNESIAVLRRFAPGVEMGPVIPKTRKGTVSHVRPSTESVARQSEPAPVGWIVFPRWAAGAALSLDAVTPLEAFQSLATNAFNYEVQGEAGFAAVRNLADRARCFRLVYSDLDEAVAALTNLADQDDR